MRRVIDMTTPVRAPKKPKNQPRPFSEAIAPSVQLANAMAPEPATATRRGLSDRQLRIALIIIWIAVMVLVGAAAGLRILSSQTGSVLPGVPVATASVNLAPLPKALPIVNSTSTSFPQPRVVSMTAVQQAQSGNPFHVIAGAAYQPTAGPDALQPGYATGLRLQGNQGTTPAP